ncbi:MAG: SusD/RagB family nutrient-binding outer membrane lipoprotein [Roseivirga sp.]|nr:SusD/RagB family nutrient-binding outer membrane lipoprotein [Roseivirga sp.]
MKLKKHISIVLLVVLAGFASCDDQFDLDLQLNPNAVTEENADVDLFFNAIQLNLAGFFNNASNLTMPAVRMTAMTGGNNYENNWSPNSFNGLWNSAYASIFPDINAMIVIAEEREQFVHVGAGQIMQGYVLMTLVDFFGDIPWTEALQGVSVPSPASDDDEGIYTVALNLLDAGIASLAKTSRGTPSNDFFYGGDAAQWTKAANTFKMKAYLNMGNTSGFNSIVSSGNYISSSADDFAFPYGTNRVNPNSRHPFYNEQYEVGGGRYHSNAFMYELAFRKSVPDPRVRYYYYRQDLDPASADQFTLDCPFAVKPFHYPSDMVFCLATPDNTDPNASLGYWGRDHGNNDGTPPDGHLKTSWGAYPAAGKFDADDATDVKNAGTDGGLGGGIAPIMMSSFVDFMRAESALDGGDAATARTLMEAGMRNSIDRVMSFSASVTDVDAAFAPSQADIDAYVAEVLGEYDAGDAATKMDLLQQQNHFAMFGNGYETYNAYRRTAAPRNLQFGREADLREFPRLMLYPADYVNLNASISGNRVISEQVFWDTLPAGAVD